MQPSNGNGSGNGAGNQGKRIAVVDIETVSLETADPKGALDAMTGRIVCIGMLFDDGHGVTPAPLCDVDERKLLERFWATISERDLLVGHNILEFDLMFIRQRSWILGVKPPIALNLKKYYTDQVVDIMALWTNWSSRFKGAGLDNIAWALGCDGSDANAWQGNHGADIATWWAAGDYNSIVKACMHDVWRTYQVYCRMHYREPLTTLSPAKPAGNPLPVFLVGDTRPLVTAAAHAVATNSAVSTAPIVTAPQAAAPPTFDRQVTRWANGGSFAPPSNMPAQQPPAPTPRRRGGRSRREQAKVISYVAAGNSLILTGETFPIKQTLKEVFGARGRKVGEAFEWEVAASQFDAIAGLCSKSGIQLIAADAGRAA